MQTDKKILPSKIARAEKPGFNIKYIESNTKCMALRICGPLSTFGNSPVDAVTIEWKKCSMSLVWAANSSMLKKRLKMA